MPTTREVLRLQQAIAAFEDNPPRNLPDGVTQGIEELKGMLSEVEPARDTPGSHSAREASGTRGTGEHFRNAAKGPDGPSPGQREARRLSEEMAEEADTLKERI